MESLLISGIAYDKDQAQVTVVGVFDEPGVAAKIFAPLAKARILVDMIIQNPSREGRTDMTFTLSRQDLPQALTILEAVKAEVGAKAVVTDDKVAKVSVIGVGMRNHSGVAAQAFTALKDERINIIMISTSEIKISMLIEERYVELAVRTLHTAFELDKAPAKATC